MTEHTNRSALAEARDDLSVKLSNINIHRQLGEFSKWQLDVAEVAAYVSHPFDIAFWGVKNVLSKRHHTAALPSSTD